MLKSIVSGLIKSRSLTSPRCLGKISPTSKNAPPLLFKAGCFRYGNINRGHRFLKPIDWRRPDVGRVRHQGQTESCSAHVCSTVLELLMHVRYHIKFDVSVQDFYNGSNDNQNVPSTLFEWVKANGVIKEVDCPWVGRLEKWQRDAGVKIYKMVSKVQWQIFKGNEDYRVAKFLQRGPVVVGIAPWEKFMSYTGGFYTGDVKPFGTMLHSVVVVALKFTDDGSSYFVCQNSYGRNWGINGYFNVPVYKQQPVFVAVFSVDLEKELVIQSS